MSRARRSPPEAFSRVVFIATPILGTDVMANNADPPRELELLGEKVRQAKEFIGRLKESNRALTAEVAELKSRLDGEEAGEGQKKTSPPRRQSKSAQSAQLELLRRERKEIREKISHLLQKLGGDSTSSSAG